MACVEEFGLFKFGWFKGADVWRGQCLTSPRKKRAAAAGAGGKEAQAVTSVASASGLIIQFLFSRILTFYIPPTLSLPFSLLLIPFPYNPSYERFAF